MYASKNFTLRYSGTERKGHFETLELKKGVPISYSTHHQNKTYRIPFESLPNNTFIREGNTLIRTSTTGNHECVICEIENDEFETFEPGKGYIISPSATATLISTD